MSLYKTYRPRTFNEVVGNESTVKSLQSILKREEGTPHAMLFTGPSGCGKTTLARLVVQELGIKAEDLIEVDSADFRGIDTIRSIRQQMRLAPLGGERRAWIMDECHQLSKDAQSALLKALEDTPSHVYFLLATTDPQKLLPTITNRCTKFEVRALVNSEIMDLLDWVLEEEKASKRMPKEVLKSITKNSLGSPRAALVMLDKVIDMEPGEMLEAVEQAARDEHQVIDLCRALIRNEKWIKVKRLLQGLQEQEPEQIRHAVLQYCNVVLLNEDEPRAYVVMDCFRSPFYEVGGMAGLTMACYETLNETG